MTRTTLHATYRNRKRQLSIARERGARRSRHLFVEALEERALLAANGGDMRHLRLAVSATEEYTNFFGSVAAAQTQIEKTVAAVNKVFNRELNLQLDLIDNTDIIFGPGTDVDPFPSGGPGFATNQTLLDTEIGSANYDIGILFGGVPIGLAILGGAGIDADKAKAFTGFTPVEGGPAGANAIDNALHEMGHQLAAEHTFNGVLSTCGDPGQRFGGSAFEPGSGTTLVSYAGICAGDSVQGLSDFYYHFHSLDQMVAHLEMLDGLGVGTKDVAVNSVPTVAAGPDFTIPARTPFAVTVTGADAGDPSGDTLRYTIEQMDLGPAQTLDPFPGDNGSSPLFRSFPPAPASDGSFTRTFPQLSDILTGTETKGEYLPTTTRELNFRATVRDGVGGTNGDEVKLMVVDTGAPFMVTSPNSSPPLLGGTTLPVTWDVAGTTGSGIDTAMVNIRLSTDGGRTFPHLLATTANDGSDVVTIPNLDTSAARIKIAAEGNIFFDISDADLTIVSVPATPGVAVTDGLFVGEAGQFSPETDTYTLTLHTAPVSPVEITVTADGQTEVSLDGVAFAASVSFMRSDTTAQTITVRAIDDGKPEGAHTSKISHAITAGSDPLYPSELIISQVVAQIADNEQPPLIAVDLQPSTPGLAVPRNWTEINTVPATLTDLVREDGLTTEVGLTITKTAGSTIAGTADLIGSLTAPIHTPDLNPTGGVLYFDNFFDPAPLDSVTANATWTGLTPGKRYNVYVLATEFFGTNFTLVTPWIVNQTVTITGAGIDNPPPFVQNSFAKQRQLLVNDEEGDDTRALETFAKTVTADATGEINIEIFRDDGVDFNKVIIAGLAIQEALVAVLDFGDAPDTYDTLLASNGPRHTLGSGLFIGVGVDDEANGQPSTFADEDDISGTESFDLASGIEFTPSVLVPDNSATVSIPVSATGKVDAFVDWNDDGDFADAGEKILDNVDVVAGPNTFPVSVPASATGGADDVTIARFRLSTAGNLSFNGAAADGEVEDFSVDIEATTAPTLDFGDAPDSYSTNAGSNGARHTASRPFLGAAVDAEVDGQPSATANGDDGANSDDEDGVTFDTPLTAGQSATITVVSSDNFAELEGFFDWNGDGNFGSGTTIDAGEQVFDSVQLNLGSNTLNFAVPANAVAGNTFARFRLSFSGGLSFDGAASQGEVEDYAIAVVAANPVLDFGDAPNTYSTLLANDGPRHQLGSGLFFGDGVDDETDGQPSTFADDDDLNGAEAFQLASGITFSGELTPGSTVTFSVPVSANGRLDAFIDWNDDGDFGDASEKVFDNVAVTTGANTLTTTIPVFATGGADEVTIARFRLSSAGGLSFSGAAANGEVEDFSFDIETPLIPSFDFGDAPAPYPTLLANNGPRHIMVVGGPFLGGIGPDAEADGQPSATAVGDDSAGTDDEDTDEPDPVTLIAGQPATGLEIEHNGGTGTGGAFLSGWIDLNQDGDWGDTDEQFLTDSAVTSGPSSTSLDSITIPADATLGTTFVRLRISTQTGLTPTGPASDGEVEDFQVTIVAPPACSTVVINTSDAGAGSLREAINCSNDAPGLQTISFNIPATDPGLGDNTPGVFTIAPEFQLPDITEAAIIDGTTQTGAVCNANGVHDLRIEISGAIAGGGANGLIITSGGATVRGLVINRFEGNGIFAPSDGNTIQCNYLGTDATGLLDAGNGAHGIFIEGGSNNLVGGDTAAARNLISGNNSTGVDLRENATSNRVFGNYIGVNVNGTAAIGNGEYGVGLYNAQNNLIGDTTPTRGTARGNVISGNVESGVDIDSGTIVVGNPSSGNLVRGNIIGLNAAGTGGIVNSEQGVAIINSFDNTIGGPTRSDGNVISRNLLQGVLIISLDVGTAAETGARQNLVQNNLIGTDITGLLDQGNFGAGVAIIASNGNRILDNVIAFNSQDPGPGETGIEVQSGIGNVFLRNAIFSNPGLGIDLSGGFEEASGVTLNDDDDTDTGANNLQNYPTLTSAVSDATTVVAGTFNSLSDRSFLIEFFANTEADPSGFGEGRTFLGFSIITTSPSGDATINFVSPTLVPVGQSITATATLVETGNTELLVETSEFSSAITVIGPAPGVADLALSKSVDDATPDFGSFVTFTVTLTNVGPDTATNVTVTDQLPAGLTFVSNAPSQGTYNNTTGVWTVGTVANGGGASLELVASVNSIGTKTNTAQISAADQADSDSTPNNSIPTEDDQASVSLTPQAVDLSLTKTVSNATPDIGDNVTFTIVASNAGPDDATNVTIGDTLPAGMTYVSDTPSQGTYNNITGVWTVGTIASGSNANLQIVASVDSIGTKTNTAQVTAADQADIDSTPNNNVATEDDQAEASVTPPLADLSLTKTVSNAMPNVGGNVTFTITASNAGPDAATSVSVLDALPAGITYISNTPSQGSFNSGTGVWTVGTIANGGNATLQIVASVNSIGTKTNTAQISAADQADVDSTPNNSVATEDDQASISVTPQVIDLSLTKTVNNATPNVGANVTFTLTLSNAGPSSATSVTLTDQLPAGLTFVSSTPSQGTYNSTTGIWTVGAIANGGNATLQIVATVGSTGTKTNTAQVTATDQADSDSTPNNNVAAEDDQASASFTVSPVADLELVKVVDNSAPEIGETVTFTVTLTNRGPDAATNVEVTERLPSGLSNFTFTPSIGTFDAGTRIWSIPSLPATSGSNTATLIISARVDTADPLTTVSEVTSSEHFDPDSTPGNNVAIEDDQFAAALGQCLTGGPLQIGVNRLIYSCVTPSSISAFVMGTTLGSLTLSPQRVSVTIDVADAEIKAFGIADSNGVAVVLIDITAEQAGQTLVFQAFEFLPEIRISNTLILGVPETPLSATAIGSGGPQINADLLPPLVDAAIARWEAAGVTEQQLDVLRGLTVSVSDLPDGYVGASLGNTVVLDRDAAGNGWFIDSTPRDDSEFVLDAASGQLRAATDRTAGTLDALTALMHEFGHALGLPDLPASAGQNHLMFHRLESDVRRLPISHTNWRLREDVNGDGRVSPLDALIVINLLNGVGIWNAAGPPQLLSATGEPVPAFPDVNADHQLAPIDALQVINFLNQLSQQSSSGEGEGPAFAQISYETPPESSWSSAVDALFAQPVPPRPDLPSPTAASNFAATRSTRPRTADKAAWEPLLDELAHALQDSPTD